MSDSGSIKNDFLKQLIKVIEEHISDELFGVSELAQEIGMSRSNLLRKLKKSTNRSVSQFIRQVKLKKAMELLKDSSLTVSEVSYKVGFSSTSYFIKCFREEYGYPPGEAGKKDELLKSEFSSPTHQLAAIMFTDIEGYTAMMQQDEDKAMKFRSRHREIFESTTQKYKGKILQYYGDGTLSTFSSAIDAVRCGIELQLSFCEEPSIPVRIGIHTGDILFSEDGIAGDGVNIASRIESLAAAQSVFISAKVYDEIKNQSGIYTASMGVFELKNVDKPVEVYAITNQGLVVPDKKQISGKARSKPQEPKSSFSPRTRKIEILWGLIILASIAIGYLVANSGLLNPEKQNKSSILEFNTRKSIAVLPFINDSNDSTNVYIINGLMESTLNNLQKIRDLRVISRTSAEKYRNATKTIPEIAKELDVHYLIEGSGQKIGDQIMLNIQLIDAQNDQHLWSEQYNREIKDIFALQKEVSIHITEQIEVIITPEEEERINKAPTTDLVAYDYFLKGYDLLLTRSQAKLQKAIAYFEKAIEHDQEFARAYAAIAISYYYLDEGQAEKKYADQISHFADQAMLFDATLPQSLIAKALNYMHSEEYEFAASYLEKALEINPNEDIVYIFLIELYKDHIPDTEKYLEYALRGLEIDISMYDSIIGSFAFLQISNAFIQSGFVDEAEKYINKSLEYYPENLYSEYVKAYILYARNRNLDQTLSLLHEALRKDTTRIDIIQEVAKIYYFKRDFKNSYAYYKKYLNTKEALNLDIYPTENAKIGIVFSEMGFQEESEKYFTLFKEHADTDQSIYKSINLAAYYSAMGDVQKSLEYMRLFSEEDHYHYWIILFLDIDPLIDNIKSTKEYHDIRKKLENKFWKYHEEVKDNLNKKGLI